MRFWLGGYGADGGGDAAGIGTLLAGEADAALAGGALSFGGTVAAAASPSWLAPHPTLDVIYTTLEHAGTVAAFRRTGETTFAPLGGPVEAGSAVCHAAVAPDGASLIASCWGDGRVVRIALDSHGAPSSPTLGAVAVDPYAGLVDPFAAVYAETGMDAAAAAIDAELAAAARSLRAAAGDEFAHLVPGYDEVADVTEEAAVETSVVAERVSRAHSAVFLDDGRIATADLGYDLVRIWRPSPGGLRLDHEVVLPRGTGPRHMVLHPSGHLHVLTEHSCEVFTLGQDRDGRWRLRGGIPASTLPTDGDAGAEIARSHDGEFLYAGLRGTNTIATLRVRGAGDRLEPVALVDAGVDWPRHHLVVRDTLLVAGQRSDDVVSLTLDTRTGVPGRVRSRTETPAPTRILPARR
jgi:6-phosphogluconolactonase